MFRMALDLTISRARSDAGSLVTANGVVDARTISRLEAALRREAVDGARVTLDLSDVDVSGAGGRVLLLNTVRRMHAACPTLRLVCPPGTFRATVDRAGLARRLNVADRLPEPGAIRELVALDEAGDLERDRSTRDRTRELREAILVQATVAIEARYADPDLTLDQIARRIAVSSRQLQRVFAELGGTTFRAELAAVRMQHAAELLLTTALPVAEIAGRIGHRQPAQFSNAFRRHHGMSPTAFRRSARQAATAIS